MVAAHSSHCQIRMLGNNDWRLWRKLRLAALAESPGAFSSMLGEWQGEGDTEARWRARLSAVALNIVAEIDEIATGMVSATAPNVEGTVELLSMWVAPPARGHGVGDALVRAVIQWAQEQQAGRIVLAVFESNRHALGLYIRHQFTDCGDISQDPTVAVRERQMVLDLSSSQALAPVANGG
jgi:ribosomal protein S18 acetylase RimI-like enzyme